jgi:hypothetical protein
MKKIMGGVAALAVAGGIAVSNAGSAQAEPIDPAQVCGIYYTSAPMLAKQYGISRREATVQAVAGWYHVSHSEAEAAFDAAHC